MMKMLILALLTWMALTVTPVPASPLPTTALPSQIQENDDAMSTVQSASNQSQLVANEMTPTPPIPATDQNRTEDNDIQSTASLPNVNPSPVNPTTSSNPRSLNSSSSEIAAAPTTLKPFAPPFPKSKDPRIKYEMIVLNDEDPEDQKESTTEATAVQPTRYWDQYDLSEWNKRQRIKMRAHQELFHRLHHGKAAPPMDSDEMMDVIPDYGEGIHYSEDDLKNMGIKKRVE
ncbi:hypothetical protein GCK72_011575 [Caenorhabditis remanei]|uniref:Uncharacterized protein n=1 Tax=Caenorhabditis remanei TaxID=31234 RepID=A0A6A5H8C0_CAERE|nr:hypothetical protein GCK72_011575 [Caenorhabditis remanei]KAF1763309.1 hypothetical protein GCK72_011575 [Caenorhabditis remanei]